MKKVSLIIALAVIALAAFGAVGCAGGTADLEDIKWTLTSYGPEGNLQSPLSDTEVTATFKSDGKEVSGNASCNLYGGSYQVDGDKLTMEGPFAVTEMWCGEEKDDQEKEYLNILLDAERYKVDGDTLTIYCGDNVLKFERK